MKVLVVDDQSVILDMVIEILRRYYEDFTFYGELVTDINLDKAIREQEIQVIFPSFLNKKIPIKVEKI